MPPSEKPAQRVLLILAVSVSLCLLILTIGAVYSVAHGQSIGSVDKLDKLGKGSGLVGLAIVLYAIVGVIVKALKPQKAEAEKENRVERSRSWRKKIGTLALSLIATFGSSIVSFSTAKLEQRRQELRHDVETLNIKVADLQSTVTGLQARRQDLLTFLKEVSSRDKIGFIHESVSPEAWQGVIQQIEALPAGQRKTTVIDAIFLAWRQVPFKLTGPDLQEGLNSPKFVRRILIDNGIPVEKAANQLDSTALRQATDEVHGAPLPGDLMFFKGSGRDDTGEYVMIYLGADIDGKGHGIGLGLMGTDWPLGIYNSTYLEGPPHPDKFQGYKRPRYKN